jgi:methanogenic corrinoid protein MtbC1
VRERKYSVVEPRILAMPSTAHRKARRLEGAAERLVEALLSAEEQACRAIVFDLFLAGHSPAQIFDDVMAVAFQTVGAKWECQEADVYQERCSCQIALRIIHELRAKQIPPDGQRLALGTTAEGDQYDLPATMAEIVLRSVGWDARLLGTSIPFDSMRHAIQRHQPGLFWLSVSFIRDEGEFIAGFNRLFDAAAKQETAVVVGGQALSSAIRTRLRYTAFCDTMQHLEAFGRTLPRQSRTELKSRRETAAKPKQA